LFSPLIERYNNTALSPPPENCLPTRIFLKLRQTYKLPHQPHLKVLLVDMSWHEMRGRVVVNNHVIRVRLPQ
jgi:hypothetical protein